MSLSAIVVAVGGRLVLSRGRWWRGVSAAHLMTVAGIRCCLLLYRPSQTKIYLVYRPLRFCFLLFPFLISILSGPEGPEPALGRWSIGAVKLKF